MEGENKKKKINLKEIGIEKLILIIIAGIVLIVCSIPSSKKDNSNNTTTPNTKTQAEQNQNDTSYEEQLESKLEQILKNIDGVGDVQVMITLKTTSEKVIKEDSQYSRSDTNETDSKGGSREISDINSQGNSIYTTDEAGKNVPYIIKEIKPQVEGIAVIAQGGDDPAIATSITNTIEALFSVSTHKISVSKMREVK